MPRQCAIKGCPNTTPLYGCVNENQYILWKSIVKYSGRAQKQSFKLCSEHFSSAQLVRDLEHELLGLPSRKRLIPNAVPDQNLKAKICKVVFS